MAVADTRRLAARPLGIDLLDGYVVSVLQDIKLVPLRPCRDEVRRDGIALNVFVHVLFQRAVGAAGSGCGSVVIGAP